MDWTQSLQKTCVRDSKNNFKRADHQASPPVPFFSVLAVVLERFWLRFTFLEAELLLLSVNLF